MKHIIHKVASCLVRLEQITLVLSCGLGLSAEWLVFPTGQKGNGEEQDQGPIYVMSQTQKSD
jgi:hypothetical protein